MLTLPLTYLATPMTEVSLPAFSKLDFNAEPKVLEKVLRHSIKYSSLAILPVAIAIAILARPSTLLLFGASYEKAWLYLSLLAISSLIYGLGGTQISNLFAAQGQTKMMMKINSLRAVVGVITGLAIIPPSVF
jgi:O-antigen/teichoic acid export membrane protein